MAKKYTVSFYGDIPPRYGIKGGENVWSCEINIQSENLHELIMILNNVIATLKVERTKNGN